MEPLSAEPLRAEPPPPLTFPRSIGRGSLSTGFLLSGLGFFRVSSVAGLPDLGFFGRRSRSQSRSLAFRKDSLGERTQQGNRSPGSVTPGLQVSAESTGFRPEPVLHPSAAPARSLTQKLAQGSSPFCRGRALRTATCPGGQANPDVPPLFGRTDIFASFRAVEEAIVVAHTAVEKLQRLPMTPDTDLIVAPIGPEHANAAGATDDQIRHLDPGALARRFGDPRELRRLRGWTRAAPRPGLRASPAGF